MTASFVSTLCSSLAALLLALTLQLSLVLLDELGDAVRAGNWVEVEALARDRLATDSNDLEAHAELGHALLERMRQLAGRPGLATELAVSAANQAIEHLSLVQHLVGFHDFWLEARAEHPRAEKGIESVLWKLAENGDPHASFLWAQRQPQARAAEALAQLERALDLRPERVDYLLAALARQLFLGRMSEARASWRRAARHGAQVDGLAAWSLELWPAVEQASARAASLGWLIEQRGLEADAWLGWYRAHALLQQGSQAEALAVFEACQTAAAPEVQRAHAALLLSLDRPQQAADLLLPLARAADWEAYEQLVSAADSLAVARRFPLALEFYDSLLGAEPRHERAQHHRALTLWRAGQDAEAAVAFLDLLAHWPDRSDLLNDAGLAALGAGARQRAATYFERAIELPQSRDAQENRAALGLAISDLDTTHVLSLLDRVLSAEPNRSRSLVLRSRVRSTQ